MPEVFDVTNIPSGQPDKGGKTPAAKKPDPSLQPSSGGSKKKGADKGNQNTKLVLLCVITVLALGFVAWWTLFRQSSPAPADVSAPHTPLPQPTTSPTAGAQSQPAQQPTGPVPSPGVRQNGAAPVLGGPGGRAGGPVMGGPGGQPRGGGAPGFGPDRGSDSGPGIN